MRLIPFLSKKDVIKGVKYSNTVVIRYVLPKRELVKIAVTVIGLEFLMHAPIRKAWADKIEASAEKIDGFFDKRAQKWEDR